nr:VWA-like domain-containing protein [Lachnospiraceae bacterium]
VRAGLSDCGSVLNIAKNHGKDPINSLLYGDEEGRGGQRGRAAEKNSNTYIDVLKEFINVKERFLEDPESIDRNMYEYGLEMYGNVALIEPEEINEENCFDTIAIAIDTSGSCGGYTVNSFLRETSNLLRDISYNSSKGRIILYQCDSCIQKKDMIEDTEGIEDKVEDIDLFGFGGTSFVPVFDDLERYEAEGRGKVDALFYLTDGFGEYPTKAPGYKTFFILPGEGYDLSDDLIPDWIEGLRMKI